MGGATGILLHGPERVVRLKYDCKDLKDISLHELALAHDIQVYNPPTEDSPVRTWTSKQAPQTLMKEAVVFCCTNSTAASPLLKILHLTRLGGDL